MIAGALAMAQVPRALRALGMTSVPSAPAQANVAASATPWQADRAKHDLGRCREPRGLALQGRGVKEAERHAQPVRHSAHRRLVGLQVEGGDAGHGLGREPARDEHAFGQKDKLLRPAAPLAAEAEGQHGGMQRDIGHVVARHDAPLGNLHRESAPVPERRPRRQ